MFFFSLRIFFFLHIETRLWFIIICFPFIMIFFSTKKCLKDLLLRIVRMQIKTRFGINYVSNRRGKSTFKLSTTALIKYQILFTISLLATSFSTKTFHQYPYSCGGRIVITNLCKYPILLRPACLNSQNWVLSQQNVTFVFQSSFGYIKIFKGNNHLFDYICSGSRQRKIFGLWDGEKNLRRLESSNKGKFFQWRVTQNMFEAPLSTFDLLV